MCGYEFEWTWEGSAPELDKKRAALFIFQDLCSRNKVDTIVTDKKGETYVFQVSPTFK